MSLSIGELVGYVDLDTKGLTRGVSQVDSSLGKTRSGFSKLAKFAAGAFAAVGAVNFLKDAFGEAQEAQKVGAQTAAVIKSTGNAAKVSAAQVGALATKISLKTGIDDEAIQTGQNMLLTFKNLRNEQGKGNDMFNQATAAMVDMSAAMGTDAKGAAIMLGKALNDPTKGLSALSRVGITFSAQQSEQIKKMQESGDMMGAQKVILKELTSEFGGSAEAIATPADKMAVAWGNLKEQVGTALMPVISKLATFATSTLIPALSRIAGTLGDKLGPTMAKVGEWVKTRLLPAFKEFGRDVLPDLKAAMGDAKKGFADAKPFFALVGDLIVDVLIPNIGKLAKTVLPLMGQHLKNIGWLLGEVGKSGRNMWNHMLQPVFKYMASALAKTLLMWGRMFQLIGKVPGFGWVGDVGDRLVRTANNANQLSQNIRDIPAWKSVKINVDDSDARADIANLFGSLNNLTNNAWTAVVNAAGAASHRAAVPGLATGGRVTSETIARIGEREPETVLRDRDIIALLTKARDAGRGDMTTDRGRQAPLIGQVIQRADETADQLAERLWFKTRTRG